jgi:hypothetical protein
MQTMIEVRITSEDMSEIVSRLSNERGRILDAISYHENGDYIMFIAYPFALFVDRATCPELSAVSQEEIKTIKLSAGGASIIIENCDIYIEAVGLIKEILNKLSVSKAGGVIMDVLQAKQSH